MPYLAATSVRTQQGRAVIAAATTIKPSNTRNARAPEVRAAARELASLALTRAKQGGRLNVRQRVMLRRALATAAEHLGWAGMAASAGDPVAKATKDVVNLTKRGASAITDEISDELTGKKTELAKLERTASEIRKMAESAKTEYPADVSYAHTARDAAAGLVTKTETVTVSDAREAEEAAQAIERKLDGWGKLKEQMVTDLKQKQKLLTEATKDLTAFVASTESALEEVIATLH